MHVDYRFSVLTGLSSCTFRLAFMANIILINPGLIS